MVLDTIPEVLTNLAAGVLVIGFGIIIGNLAAIITRKVLVSFEGDRLLKKAGVSFPLIEFVANALRYILYIVGLIWGLTFFGLETIVLYIILFGLLAVFVLFILLSIKDIMPNFFAGIYIMFTKKVKEGQRISMESAEGKVVEINLLDIELLMKDGDRVVVPHILLLKNVIVKKKKTKK